MLIDRHRCAALIALAGIGSAPLAVRNANKEAIEALLVALYQAATPEARQSFITSIAQVPLETRPWAYVQRSSPDSTPPMLVLLLGQQDDDPDSSEDGNRLPNRGTTEGVVWLPLYSAFDRWDTATIAQHIGPTGWSLPPDNLGISRDAQGVESPPPPPSPVLTRSTTSETVATPGPAAAPPPAASHEWRQVFLFGAVAGVSLGAPLLYQALKR